MHSAPAGAPLAGLGRRTLALTYEALLLVAVLCLGALPFLMLTQEANPGARRLLLQIYLLALCGAYFVWQWLKGGQTLPMKTWRIRLVTRDGAPLTLRHGVCRYLLATAGTLLFGSGFLWALLDPERQFLHDRLAGTKIVQSG
ncbi:MAG: RDD family protein [Burkholderiales bacterium]|nr:RDD family protein [Burkholderiales bacterium]